MTQSVHNHSVLRPILVGDHGAARCGDALAGGWMRFSEIAVETAASAPQVLPAAAVAALHPELAPTLARLRRPRAPLGPLRLDRPLAIARTTEPLPQPALAAAAGTAAAQGAAALEVCCTALAGAEGWTATGEGESVLLPLAKEGLPPAPELAPAGWRAPDWAALASRTLPSGCLRVSPRTATGLADAAGVRAFHEAVGRRLEVLDAAGIDRAMVVLDLGPVAPEALGALALLHGLGCTLMVGLDMPPFAAAAGAVVAACQGLQLVQTTQVEAVAAGLELWRAASGPAGAWADASVTAA